MQLNEIDPHYFDQWQNIVDLIAKIARVRSAAVTRILPPDWIEAFKVSRNPDNPFHEGLQVELADHYCEEVINKKEKVLVSNAITSERWRHAPEIKHGLVSYLGYPLRLPSGEIFGTICIHDDKENAYSTDIDSLLKQFRDVVEAHFALDQQAKELKTRIEEIQSLRGIIPICAQCKNIRNDKGYWQKVEVYIKEHSGADFTHSICPDCAKKLYPGLKGHK